MTGRTHGAWGMAAGAGIAYASLSQTVIETSLFFQLLGVLLGGLAALIPDIDAPQSLIQSLPAQEGRRSGVIPLAIVGAILSGILRVTSAIVRLFTRHRAITHTVWALLAGSAISGVVAWLGVAAYIPVRAKTTVTLNTVVEAALTDQALHSAVYVAAVFAAGWFTHLLLDSMTVEGIRPINPPWNVRFRLLRFRTGGPADTALRILGDAVFGLLLVLYCVRLVQEQGWLSFEWLPW